MQMGRPRHLHRDLAGRHRALANLNQPVARPQWTAPLPRHLRQLAAPLLSLLGQKRLVPPRGQAGQLVAVRSHLDQLAPAPSHLDHLDQLALTRRYSICLNLLVRRPRKNKKAVGASTAIVIRKSCHQVRTGTAPGGVRGVARTAHARVGERRVRHPQHRLLSRSSQWLLIRNLTLLSLKFLTWPHLQRTKIWQDLHLHDDHLIHSHLDTVLFSSSRLITISRLQHSQQMLLSRLLGLRQHWQRLQLR